MSPWGFSFIKKDRGYYTRLGTALGIGLIAVLGCATLYQGLEGITTGEVVTPDVKVWIRAGVPAVLFLVFAWIVFKIVNTPRLADFMIATEGEMKKVSWSTKKEIATSTKVVLVTVLFAGGITWCGRFCFCEVVRDHWCVESYSQMTNKGAE